MPTHHLQQEHDPTQIPWVDLSAARNPQSPLYRYSSRTLDAAVLPALQHFASRNNHAITANRDKLYPPACSDNVKPYDPNTCDTIVCMPVSVDHETIEGIVPTFESLDQTIASLGKNALVLAWLNFTAPDYRYEALALAEKRNQAITMARAIHGMFRRNTRNPSLFTWPPVSTSIPNKSAVFRKFDRMPCVPPLGW